MSQDKGLAAGRRVVVTGMGIVSPLGCDVEGYWQAILAGESGVTRMPAFDDIADLGARIAGPVRDFTPERIPRKLRRSMSRMSQYAHAATADAISQAHLGEALLTGGRVAIAAGSTTGSPDAMEEFWTEYLGTHSIRGILSTSFLRVMSHTVASHLALAFGVTGPVHAPCCACAASNQAIGLGLDLIRRGRADVVIAGGADELSVLSAATFDVVRAGCRGHEDAPTTRPAPFDRTRDGVVCAEGAAIVILEERAYALARGAPILAEVSLGGARFDDDRQTLWVAPRAGERLGFIDLQSFRPGEVRLDGPVTDVIPLRGDAMGRTRVAAVPAAPGGWVTLLDARAPRRETAASVRGFLLSDILDTEAP